MGRAPKDVQVLFVNQIPALKPVAKIMMFQESQSKSKITRMLEQLNNVKVLNMPSSWPFCAHWSLVSGIINNFFLHNKQRFYGVMVSTLDSESSDPSSNLGRT